MPMPRSAVARPVMERACPRIVTERIRAPREQGDLRNRRGPSWKTAIGELAVKTYLGTTRNHRARDDYYHDNNKQLHFCPHTAPVKLILPTLRPLCEKTRVLKWRFGSLVGGRGMVQKIKSELSLSRFSGGRKIGVTKYFRAKPFNFCPMSPGVWRQTRFAARLL